MSDYEAMGGAAIARQVVDRLYELVHGDDQLGQYFVGVDLVNLKRHQVRVLSQVLGGPVAYTGRALQDAHRGLAISPEHYERWSTYLAGVLREAGVGIDVLMRVNGVLAELEAEVLDERAAAEGATIRQHGATGARVSLPLSTPNGHNSLPPGTDRRWE